MANLKERPAMDKLKVRTEGFVPRQAADVPRRKPQEEERSAPGQKGPVRYATDKVETTEKRAAEAVGSLAIRKAKARFFKQHRQNTPSSYDTAPPPTVESPTPAHGEAPVWEPVSDSRSTPLDTSYERAPSVSNIPQDTQHFSTRSTDLSTTYSVEKREIAQYTENSVAGRRRQAAIQNTRQASIQNAEQPTFETGEHSYGLETRQQNFPTEADRPTPPADHDHALSVARPAQSSPPPFQSRSRKSPLHSPTADNRGAPYRMTTGRTVRTPQQTSRFRLVQRQSGPSTPQFRQTAGSNFRYKTVAPKLAPSAKIGGRAPAKKLSPAQRAKAAARRKAQKELARRTAKRTALASKKVGRIAVRLTMAVGRTAVAAVQALLAASSSTVLLIVLLCLLVVAAIAASPFGIVFSGEGSAAGGVPLSVAVGQISFSFNQTLADLQGDERYDDVTVSGSAADWVEVVAVFAVKVTGSNETDATDVVTLDADRIDRLEAVFWDMTTISQEVREVEDDSGETRYVLDITITAKSAEEMAAEYSFTEQQQQMLQELLANRAMLQELIGSLGQITADAEAVLGSLPEDLTLERESVVRAACSLVGKVGYFWGGKSQVIGWDSRWGQLMKVTAAGSSTTGTYRPYGLDCSGFVSWVFYNATGGEPVMTGSAAMQHTYCSPVSWSEAQPGDLVFYADDSHVGIVAGNDDTGNVLIVHCTPSGGVVITGQEYFSDVGRPTFYGGA